MSSKRLSKIKSSINYRLACWLGSCPTSEELENSKVKSLANRLRAESHKETLTNLLEWQDRNITFWTERHPISTLFLYITIVMFAVLLAIRVLGFVSSFVAIILVSFQVAWTCFFISSITTLLVTIIWILHSNRKIPVIEILNNVLVLSLSIDALLENRLAVCRDYAKLTACLLLNIYPDAEIYFASAPSHCATGIKIEEQLYMLDQRLPILTIHKWDKYRRLEKLERFTGNCLINADKRPFLSKANAGLLDTQKLAINMKKLLEIKGQIIDEAVSILEIRWKKGSILYEDEEIVNYSLSRWLRTKISSEVLELNEITNLEVVQDKSDLIFHICFKSRK